MAEDDPVPEFDFAAGLRAQRDAKNKPEPPPEVTQVLQFVQHDMARLIDRLAAFATEPPAAEKDRESAAAVGRQLARIAEILHRQDAESWSAAARNIRGRRAWKGWNTTCLAIGRSEDAVARTHLAADRLHEAGRVLQKCPEVDTAASLARLAREATQALVSASTCWNESLRFQESRNKASDWLKERARRSGEGGS